jgi:hypothetical protein
MSAEILLFPAAEVAMDSPRRAWIKRNHVVTYFSADREDPVWYAGRAEAPVADAVEWMFRELGAHGNSGIGEGATEEEAITEMAIKHDLPLWN